LDASAEPSPPLPDDGVEHSIQDHYRRFSASGLTYQGEFACVRSLMTNPRTDGPVLAWGHIRLPEETDCAGYFIHPALLDGCLQVTMTALEDRPGQAWMPVGVKEYRFYQSPRSSEVVSIVKRIRHEENNQVQIDLAIVDSANSVVAEIVGLTLKEVSYHAEALLGIGLTQTGSPNDECEERSFLDPRDRVPIFVRSRIAAILDLSAADLDLAQPLIDLGMDSIMAIELRNDILTEFRIELSMDELLDLLNPLDLIARLTERLEGQALKPEDPAVQNDWVEGAI
jgi:acyl carrier protein